MMALSIRCNKQLTDCEAWLAAQLWSMYLPICRFDITQVNTHKQTAFDWLYY